MKKNSRKIITEGSILLSPLFRRFLVPIILTMMAFSLAVYFFAVPYLRDLVYSHEEKSVQTNLNNIHKLIEANSLAIEAYKKSVTAGHKRQLKNIVLFMETYLNNKYDQVQKGIISEDEAQWTALEELRAFRYGKNDYVWVADYNGYYLSHPDPNMHMEDFSKVRDVFGNYVLSPLVQQAMEKGEGYHSFWWQRLENDLPAEKLTYAKLFPQWEWVIGTGVYLDDLQTEIILRKEMMIDELRQILKKISIAKTGYMYIIDSWHNIIIHPDSTLENTDMSSWINPATGNSLAADLIVAAQTNDGKVAHMWNRPDDDARYIYDKIDWVRHVDKFDWYVVASVYTDELNTSSILLRNRLLALAGAVVMLSIIIISLLISRLLNPIRRLSYTAALVEAGDLSAQSDIKANDEIGFLSNAFNSMVAQLRDIIKELDEKVLERTKDLHLANDELTVTVKKLEQHNWIVTQMNHMAEKLQTSQSLKEIYAVIPESLSVIFDQASGILYMCFESNDGVQKLKPVSKWGKHTAPVSEHSIHECRSLREGTVVISDMEETSSYCEHIQTDQPYVSICMPLFGQKEALGMIHLIFNALERKIDPGEYEHNFEIWERLAITVSDQLAMALANMKLSEKLQNLSVRDGLTGLYNRRYMDETLIQLFREAEQGSKPVGLIMLDVDFFKKFNDHYGHEAGDIVLIRLAGLLANGTRKGDVVCRYGGEEFLVIMPGSSKSGALQRAEAIRVNVEKELIIEHKNHTLQVKISLGVAAYPDHGSTHEQVLKAADDALYEAKKQGRNRVESAEDTVLSKAVTVLNK